MEFCFKDVKEIGLIDRLSAQYDVLEYARKSSIYLQGKRTRYLYYPLNGKVKTFKMYEDGKEYITNLYTKGDFIGYGALLNDLTLRGYRFCY